MPNSSTVPDAASIDFGTNRSSVGRFVQAVRTGKCPPDRDFDCVLPDNLGVVSYQYWTPLRVAERAAGWFDTFGIQTVVDIGSGAGKFCIAAALFSNSRFIGLEQRASLIAPARVLTQLFDVAGRVSFVEGAFGKVATPIADAYYLFNPFGEYFFGSRHDIDAGVEFTDERYAHDVAAVEQLFQHVPAGTCVLTYNGFGGRVPATFELIDIDRSLPSTLRFWRKQS